MSNITWFNCYYPDMHTHNSCTRLTTTAHLTLHDLGEMGPKNIHALTPYYTISF